MALALRGVTRLKRELDGLCSLPNGTAKELSYSKSGESWNVLQLGSDAGWLSLMEVVLSIEGSVDFYCIYQ